MQIKKLLKANTIIYTVYVLFVIYCQSELPTVLYKLKSTLENAQLVPKHIGCLLLYIQ